MVWASSVVASAEPVRRMLRGRCAPQRGVAAPAAGCAALLRAPGSCTPAAVAAAGAAQHRALLPLTGAATAKSALQTRGGGSASGPGAPSDQAAVSRGRRSAATQPCGAHGGASASVDAMASPHWGTHAGAGNDAAANMSGMQPGLAGAGSLSPSWWDGAMSLPSWAMGLARALVSAPAQIEREAASPGAAPPAAQRAQLHGTASVPEAAEEAPKVLPQRHPQQQLHKQQQMPQPQPHHHHQQQQQQTQQAHHHHHHQTRHMHDAAAADADEAAAADAEEEEDAAADATDELQLQAKAAAGANAPMVGAHFKRQCLQL
uniref:Uncharacterized protein n=1 Tax=Chlamydomonas euryale TaxID=1486919 RepID=A0A7R9Z6C7_9CHLO|mmetsp:Transcript_5848/g.17916  ORF Transcript_5848/g.17916 Transcript_5848/m.17916 type:complete len:318 (+) Transcript_5848:317-1270(+)